MHEKDDGGQGRAAPDSPRPGENPSESGKAAEARDARAKRLAAQLRANLKRRKEQARRRAAPGGEA